MTSSWRYLSTIVLLAFLGTHFALAEEFIVRDDFRGRSNWSTESGKSSVTKSEDGHLLLSSIKDADGGPLPAVTALTVALEKNTDYAVKIRFRFEKNFQDAWPWSSLEVWSAESKWDDTPDKRLATLKITPKKDFDNGQWQALELPFNSEGNTSVIIRLRNNPKMMDQTHWDDFSVEKK
ncbi:MAG: hypothetical protein B9S32_00740 [Verrucomicrobia bacterium Tous-C9LFEB]|nr:MAG: hypothetical protein B9S32_00740 [Verrucomicrobia bacterium Tous-C9LFEB]